MLDYKFFVTQFSLSGYFGNYLVENIIILHKKIFQ